MYIALNAYRLCLLPAFWLSLLSLWGQTTQPEELNIRQGLSQGFIASLLQDREGFIWAGTKNGLNRYDGRRFKVFTADPAYPYSLSHDFVSALWEHGDFLLVGTNGGGLNFYHKKTQRFYRMPDTLPGGGRLETPGILKVAVDAQGNIWLINWITYLDGRLYRVLLPPGFWERLPEGRDIWEGVSVAQHNNGVLRNFHLARNGKRLFYCRDSILVEINTQTAAEQQHPNPAISAFSSIAEDGSDVLWVGCQKRLESFDGKNWTSLPTDFGIRSLYNIGPDNKIIIFTEARNLLCLTLDKARPMLREQDALIQVADRNVYLALFDQSGNIWYGTNGYGLYRVNPMRGRFQTYFSGTTVYSQPLSLGGSCFVYFDDMRGIVTSDPTCRHPLVAKRGSLPGMGAHGRFQQDAKGNSWLLFFHNSARSCVLFLSADGSRYEILPTPENETRPGNLAIGADGKIWIGLNGKFYSLDPVTKQFVTHDYRAVLPSGHDVRALAQTPDGHWWIGTSLGLVEAKPKATGFDFHLWKNEPDNPRSLRNEDVACLLIDPTDPDLVWIGTKGSGLNRFDTRTKQFSVFTTKNGLPNDVVYGILPDAQGYLWLSTNKGLCRFHPGTGAVKNFTADDGLQSDEFNTWAYGKTPSGELMFGGVKGLNVFSPKDFKDNPALPKVLLTGIKINNREIAPNDSTDLLVTAPEFTGQIRLPFHSNSITLEFAALEFTTPAKNRFRYYLEGAEAEWAHESSEPSAQYLNLAPGEYTFKVMACNNDGVWNPTPATLQVEVLPPWYRSWWAYLVYALIAAAIFYTYLRLRLRQMQLRQNLALEHREAERIRELEQFKSRLFTNVTHEFRTPLTVILGVTEQIERESPEKQFADLPAANTFAEGLKKRLVLVRRNGRDLLELVNQLLDLAKAESNQLKVNFVQGDIVRYVRYITESFHSIANHNNVLLRVESKMPELNMCYDPEKMRQILSNLISNALKFTPSGGKIDLRLQTEDAKKLVIAVADSGAGIAPEDLPHIFDRFYQADNSVSKAGGTGIGLALTKELVKLLRGNISVQSEIGKGTTFVLQLPIEQTHSSTLPEEITDFLTAENESRPDDVAARFPGTNRTSTQTNTGEGPCILVVEDNADVVEYLRLCLSANENKEIQPYLLDFAYNGRAGIEMALETVPDLILSDVMMPEKDGFEVCDTLKNDERTSHIPIVLLTAKADVESRIAGLRRGADAYLAKPFHPVELLVTIEKLLENRRRLQARYSNLSLVAPAPVLKNAKPAADTVLEDAFLEKLRYAVESRLDNPNLAADDVCREVGMGRSNLYAKLSALTGLSFNLYVRKLRLNKAQKLLQTAGMNVSEVAYEVGFNDPKYFSRVFAEEFGMPPSAVKPTNPV